MRRTGWPRGIAAASACVLLSALTGCGTSVADTPRCGSLERVGLIAQSVPSTSYVPCIAALPQGWRNIRFVVRSGLTGFAALRPGPWTSSRGGAAERLRRRPGHAGAAENPGGRTYLELRSIDPRYAGTMYDVFPGGCVTYMFDLERGPHIALMAELSSMVGFVSRRQLGLVLRQKLGVELDK
jgi:hypothetical protein